MLYSISDLLYNNQIEGLPDGKLHITMDNAKLFFLTMHESKIDRSLGMDLKREYSEYEALGVTKDQEQKWILEIFDEITHTVYEDDRIFARDYLHLFRYLDTKEKKAEYLSLLDQNLLRFRVNDARMEDCFHTIYQLLNDKDIPLENKKRILISIRSRYEEMGFSEDEQIGSYYLHFLNGLIPTIGIGDEALDDILYEMIPENFVYFRDIPYLDESRLYAYLFGIGTKKSYTSAYNELKKLIPSTLPNQKKIDLILSGINRRSHMNYTMDDVMECSAEIDMDEVYFNTPGTKITLENAKRYYQFMNCSWFLIGKEYRERAKELEALKIPHETYQEWKREYMLEKLHSNMDIDALWKYICMHSSLEYSKDESIYLFSLIKPYLESHIIPPSEALAIVDFMGVDTIKITGLMRTFRKNRLKKEQKYLYGYLKKCLRNPLYKDSSYIARIKKAIKLSKGRDTLYA